MNQPGFRCGYLVAENIFGRTFRTPKAIIGDGITITLIRWNWNCGTDKLAHTNYLISPSYFYYWTEIFTIERAVRMVETWDLPPSNLIISLNSHAAINVLGSDVVKSLSVSLTNSVCPIKITAEAVKMWAKRNRWQTSCKCSVLQNRRHRM